MNGHVRMRNVTHQESIQEHLLINIKVDKMNIKKQVAKASENWTDENGQSVPYNRTTDIERMKEKYAYKIADEAYSVHKRIVAFKEGIKTMCEEVFNTVMNEKERAKATKGNFTWYNFNGSIKIEIAINELIEFDGLEIEKAKQKLMELVGESINKDAEFMKELVLSAFQTSKGSLDTKKVLGLKKHADRIKDERYHEAMALIDKSVRRPTSKTYFRVWVKNESGEYKNIDLNFSSI